MNGTPEPAGVARDAPTLGVFVGNYNHGALVGRALEAILTQSRPPDEVVIVDDGSTDDSVRVIKTVQARHPSLRLISHAINRGLSAAYESALPLMGSEYLYFAASDDAIVQGFFEAAMGMAARHRQAGILCGKIQAVAPDGTALLELRASRWDRPTYAGPREFMSQYLETESPMHSLSGATIYRRAALEEIGIFRIAELGNFCDSFALRAIALKHGACYLPQVCMRWTVMPGGISQSSLRDPGEMRRVRHNTAALMRSPEFRDLFPETYVRRWEEEYARACAVYGSGLFRLAFRWYARLARIPCLSRPVRALGEWFRRSPIATGRRFPRGG